MNSFHQYWRALVVIAAAMLSLKINAGVIGGTMPIALTFPTLNGAGPDNFRKVFIERQGYVLMAPLEVEHAPVLIQQPYCAQAANYLNDEFKFQSPPEPMVIPAGTRINSYYLYIDPEVFNISGINWTTVLENEGSPTCPGESVVSTSSVAGYIYTSSGLDNSDFLGNSSTNYPIGNQLRGLESGDEVSIALSAYGFTTITVEFDASDPFDAIRVIEIIETSTEPAQIPIPIFWLGLFGLTTIILGFRNAT